MALLPPPVEKKTPQFYRLPDLLRQLLPYPLSLNYKPQFHGAVFLLTHKAHFPVISPPPILSGFFLKNELFPDRSLFSVKKGAMERALDTKKQILEAAENLFEYYGFQKTSMADIARDCHMSAANIYRFYEGKEEILAEIADSMLKDIENKLRDVIRRPKLFAAMRIETFIVENLRHLDMICSCHAKLDEALEYIKGKRPDLFGRHMEAKRSMVAEILAEGNRNREFEIEDIVGTANLILNATFLCKCQWVDGCPPIDEVEQAAKGIIRLLINGLKRG